ncbi:hypothetical protein [Cellulomonas humilata]|uniref:Type II secretory pathway pseudopilin PulG n=1 Tax=Cellulomonas humilata TaxID=144055 RepID=A0ABU0EF54_9CELL|nr:hypothetical protein [Cellulomonas humilata]MDQ0373901.1 type II secretory pathway pseudopilin PulG [Cellulomonas humilata]
MRRILAARLGPRREEGIALLMVIGVSLVLALLAISAVSYAIGSQRKARSDQDWNAAMAAAYAAVEEYQSRLANDPGYFVYGNPSATFAPTSVVTLPTGASANPAFGLGASGAWANIAGSGGAAQFRYEVDNSKYYSSGTLRLRATGRAGGETRSLVADLRQRGFIDFLYFTNYEIIDPVISGATGTCEIYRYAGRSTANPPSGCGAINFRTGDVIDGPLHTNDAFQIDGNPVFKGWTTTSYNPTTGLNYFGTGTPSFPAMPGGKPVYEPILAMPATNTELKKETRPDLPLDVPRPGCLYTGPTKIVFKANGKMQVTSPWTKVTSPVAGTNNAGCGTPGSAGLGSATGQEIDAPDNNVVFVQNVPSLSTDPNYWATGATGTPVCLAESHASTGTNIRNAAGNPVGYPATGEYVANASVYGCRNGDVFVQGTVNAKATLAAENYIYITDDITYASADDDILGLVGQNAVWVWKPEKQNTTAVSQTDRTLSQRNALAAIGYDCVATSSTRYRCDGRTFSASDNELIADTDRRIDAAILSVAHTFMVQNYNRGDPRGTLTVNGAIAQKFRGTVGTGSGATVSTGYLKDYKYDKRFSYVAPPKFLSPTSTTYGVNVWVEIAPVFGADGAYR